MAVTFPADAQAPNVTLVISGIGARRRMIELGHYEQTEDRRLSAYERQRLPDGTGRIR